MVNPQGFVSGTTGHGVEQPSGATRGLRDVARSDARECAVCGSLLPGAWSSGEIDDGHQPESLARWGVQSPENINTVADAYKRKTDYATTLILSGEWSWGDGVRVRHASRRCAHE